MNALATANEPPVATGCFRSITQTRVPINRDANFTPIRQANVQLAVVEPNISSENSFGFLS